MESHYGNDAIIEVESACLFFPAADRAVVAMVSWLFEWAGRKNFSVHDSSRFKAVGSQVHNTSTQVLLLLDCWPHHQDLRVIWMADTKWLIVSSIR
jgi:hypothetical protein